MPVRVVLVANFLPERQYSMLQFADILGKGLRAKGIVVNTLRPLPLFARIPTKSRFLRKWLAYIDKFILFPVQLAMHRHGSTEIMHVCDQSNAMYLNFLPKGRCLVTCHDLLAVRSAREEFPEHRTGWSGRILQRWILSGLRRAATTACDSDATLADVQRILGPDCRAQLIYQSIADRYFAGHETERRKRRGNADVQSGKGNDAMWSSEPQRRFPDQPFIIHVGGTQWYKNRGVVRRVYRALRREPSLVVPLLLIVGERDGEEAAPGEMIVSDLSTDALAECYRRAVLLLFPSIAEGFGLPILEAQACGCLVVTTGKPPMNEIGGSAPIYVADPQDISGFVKAVFHVLTMDTAEAQQRRQLGYQNAKRFRSDAMVANYLELYQKIAL